MAPASSHRALCATARPELSWLASRIFATQYASLQNRKRAARGARTNEFHDAHERSHALTRGGLGAVSASKQPFTMLSLPGFVRDEGVANSARIFGRVVRRMTEIRGRFSRHRDYFSYVVLSGDKRA